MDQLFSGGTVEYTLANVVINIVLTFALAFIIALVYKRTHKGLSYSQSFVFTLVVMSLVVAIVMMVIGNSLARAFGLLGAFSIIRFRTAVKDTKDTGFIFFSLAMGMAVGTNNYDIAVVGAALVLAAIFFLDKINFGSIRKHEYLLSFTVRHTGGTNGDTFEPLFKKFLKSSMLLNIHTRSDGQAEMAYHVNFVDERKKQEFVNALSKMGGVADVQLITSREDVEY